MARRLPYGDSPAEQMAFIISVPVRRFLLLHAAQHGRVHARDLMREFPEYDRFSASDVFRLIRDKGFLKPDKKVLDVAGLPNQLTYVLTPKAREALLELHAMTSGLLTQLSLPMEAQDD